MKPKVFELIGSFVSGGSERQCMQLAKSLSETGAFEVIVGCLDRSGPVLAENKWLNAGKIPEFKLNSFYDPNFVYQVYRCAAFLKVNQIDVIHTHDFYSNIFGMISGFLSRVPVRIASKRESSIRTERQMQVERLAFKLAHRIVVNSEMVGSYLYEQGIPREKLETIYNGVNVHRYARSNSAPNIYLENLHGKRLVAIVANLRSDVKNHSMFLRVAKRVSDAIDSVEFVIAGEGELMDQLKAQARELGIERIVHFIGPCGDVPHLLSISEVGVLTSRSEGFSNAILEYMAAGKPVVATRVGGAPEAVLEGGTGFLVESDDDELMAQRIIELMKDPRQREIFGNEGRSRAAKLFSVEAQINNTVKLYDELLSGTRPRSLVKGTIGAGRVT